jgi:hypothetical protein
MSLFGVHWSTERAKQCLRNVHLVLLKMSKKNAQPIAALDDGVEEEYVTQVYDAIASDFSRTRYKAPPTE